jgi:hypothetical protein
VQTFEANRKACLAQQTRLRELMLDSGRYAEAMQLFLRQHAMLHSAAAAEPPEWSFQDEVLAGVSEEQIRRIPPGGEHSIAWLIWHMARCEDIPFNLLVAGTPQVLHRDSWLEKMGVAARDTGNAMDVQAVADLSAAIDTGALLGYRLAVARRTRQIAAQLTAKDLARKVDRTRLERIKEEGAVVEAAWGIAEYWGNRTIAGLLLMPATRHNLTHLNEALQLTQKKP